MPYLYEVIPIITVSSIPDWKAFGDWVYSLINQSVSVSNEIKIKATELTANSETRNEKIKILYDYVREEIDYIQADLDRGGLKPHSADDVLRNKYGDCKDQVVLLFSLLQAVDIEAFPALINTYSYRNHQNFIPSQYFDHLIVYVKSDSADLWLDTTTDLDNFPKLYSGDQDRWALVIDQRDVRFIKTPASGMEDNVGILNLTMDGQKDSLTGVVEITSYGKFKEYLISFLDYYSKSDRDQYYKEIVESYFYQVAEVKNAHNIEALNNMDGLTQIFKFKYLQPTNEYSILPYSSSIILAITVFYVALPFEENRRFDYYFPFKFVIKGRELLAAPWKHSSTKNIPASDSVINDYFTFNQEFEEFQDSILVKWKFALKETYIPKDDYEEFYSDLLKVEEMTAWEINFQKQLGFEDIVENFSSSFGVNLDSVYKSKEFIPPRYLNETKC